jgi:hypothetical protein
MVLDEGLNVLCQINDEVADFKGTVHTPSIAASDDEGDNAAIEFGSELLTSNYTPVSDNAIATVGYIQEVLSGGIGDDNSQLPGNGGNSYWQNIKIIQQLKKDNEPPITVQEYGFMTACDGIFSDGLHWSADGENWNTSNPSLNRALFRENTWSNGEYGLRTVKSPAEGLYYSPLGGGHYSYDMKTWTATYRFQQAFYFDGKIRGKLGENYFDVTVPGSALPAKAPKIPVNFINSPSYYKGMADNGVGDYAMAVLYIPAESANVLYLLSPDDGTNDWGWEPVTLPSEPENILFAKDKWWVFCSDKVYAIDDVSSPGTATVYDLPVAANWDLVTSDGVSIMAANSDASVSVFLQGDSAEFRQSLNFVNKTTLRVLSGTNGRTLFSMAYSQSEQEEEVVADDGSSTTVTWTYDVREYLRTGIGNAFGNPDLIIGGGTLAPSDSVYLAEPVDTEEQNGWWDLYPTRRFRSDAPDAWFDEPATIRTQEQANSLFSNKIYQLSHEKPNVVVLSQAEYDAIPADEIADNTLYLIT